MDEPLSLNGYYLQPDGRYKGPDGHFYFRGQRDGRHQEWINADIITDDLQPDEHIDYFRRR